MARAFDPEAAERPLFDSLVHASRRFGPDRLILEDQERKPLSYRDLIRASFALGRKMVAGSAPGDRIGLLLPSSSAVVVAFFGLQAFGRVPAMLNFTAGARNLKAACVLAGAKRVMTSRRFVAQAHLEDLILALTEVAEVVYLEDVRKSLGPADGLFALAAAQAPRLFRRALKPSDPGVVLFTSGSFAAPKGVVLSQGALTANVAQIAAHVELDTDWVLFNPMPTFHSLGLTGGVLLPLFEGMKAFEYPSPLHLKIIPGLIKNIGASILLATDTFLNQWARAAEPGDLSGLHLIVCGAEKVRDETHALRAERFGVEVLEGYGATEAAPVIAVNQPGAIRRGTVGRLLPGVEARLEPIEGIPEGGRLHVRGPNIMTGYLHSGWHDLARPHGGWHDTGDVVDIDAEGYVRIIGRAKRFAKIGGEMVSLAAAEDLAAGLWPQARHAVVAVADPRKGERLVLVTEAQDADPGALSDEARRLGASELMVPRRVLKVADLPLLGTGKTDYGQVQRIVEADV